MCVSYDFSYVKFALLSYEEGWEIRYLRSQYAHAMSFAVFKCPPEVLPFYAFIHEAGLVYRRA